MERLLPTEAARWKTVSTPAATAASTVAASRTSPSTNRTPDNPSMLLRYPEKRLSGIVTSQPKPNRRCTRLGPMNPAPPVTSARKDLSADSRETSDSRFANMLSLKSFVSLGTPAGISAPFRLIVHHWLRYDSTLEDKVSLRDARASAALRYPGYVATTVVPKRRIL